MDEKYYDAVLNIMTGEDRVITTFTQYYPYQPTPYAVLEQLTEHYKMGPDDHVVDFGCGKGRSLFYLNHVFDSYVCGIEMNEKLFQDAENNRKRYLKRNPHGHQKIQLLSMFAENYPINEKDNKFYFFNPFSIEIFKEIIDHIIESVRQYPRTVDLILYYPSIDYIEYLEKETSFFLAKEIQIRGDFEKNHRECILVFELQH